MAKRRRSKKPGARRGARKATLRPKAPASAKSAQAERRALRAVSLMRKGLSRAKAAKRAGTTPRTIQKYAKSAIRRREGAYEALPADQMRRPMRFLTEEGVIVLDIHSSRSATKLAKHWAAVDRYLRTGERDWLRPFEGKRLRAGGHLYAYVTDPILLVRLAEAGEVLFEDLYEATA